MKISFFESISTKPSTNASSKAGANTSTELSTQRSDDKKLKFYFKSLFAVFSITAVISFLLISSISQNFIKKENSTDYVSVFKESDLYEILFTENE